MSVAWVSAPVGTDRPAVIVDQMQGDMVTAFRGRFYVPGHNVQAELTRFLGKRRQGIVAISGVGRTRIAFREDYELHAGFGAPVEPIQRGSYILLLIATPGAAWLNQAQPDSSGICHGRITPQ
jgi:hypothetical protein